MTRFIESVEQELRVAGWFPGRNVFSATQLPSTFELIPPAARILDEFGGLHIGRRGFGVDNVKLVLDIDAMKGEYADDRFEEFVGIINCRLYPIGELDGENFYLAVDEKGRIFLIMDDLWFVADTFDKALERLLTGRKVFYVDQDGTWESGGALVTQLPDDNLV